MNTTTSIQTPEASTRRPVIIMVLCVLGLIGAAGNVPTIFADAARNVGAWFPPFLALSVVVTVVCMIGLWKMRRWAVFVYTGLALVALVIALMTGAWNVTAQLVRVAVIAVMFFQISKMR
jgi:hypothetical protein